MYRIYTHSQVIKLNHDSFKASSICRYKLLLLYHNNSNREKRHYTIIPLIKSQIMNMSCSNICIMSIYIQLVLRRYLSHLFSG